MRVRPLHLVLLIVVILVAVAFCVEADAAPPLTVTQFYQRSVCNNGMCKTRKVERSGQGAVVGRLGDGRCIVVCPAAGRSMGMAYITLPDEEKPISATVLAVSRVHNAAIVAFHHPEPLPSINLAPELRSYLITQLGELPRRDAAPGPSKPPRTPPPPPSGPPVITDPPLVPEPDAGPLPPPPQANDPPGPAGSSPASKPQHVTQDEFQSMLQGAVSKGVEDLKQFNAAHHTELKQQLDAVAKNANGIQGIPDAVANIGKTLGPKLAKDALAELLPKVESEGPGWLADAAKMLGFNTLLGSAGGPVGLAVSAIASAWGIGKFLIGRFRNRTNADPSPQGPAPTSNPASVSAPAPPAAGAVSPSPPATKTADSSAPTTTVNTAVVEPPPNNAGVQAYQDMKEMLMQDPSAAPKLRPLISKMDSFFNQSLAGRQQPTSKT